MELRALSLGVLGILACERRDPVDDHGDTGSDVEPSTGVAGDDAAATDASSSGIDGISESGTTRDQVVTSSQGDESSSGAPMQCAELGEQCTEQDGCCAAPDGGRVCVAERDGASCHVACSNDDDCDSGCCVSLHGELRACMDASQCIHDCAPLHAACTQDEECCDGTSCTEGMCTVMCEGPYDCPGSEGCQDGRHDCVGGETQFLCDDDAWYAVDCDAACIEAGHSGSSGCGWSDLYEDDVCLCVDGRSHRP